MTKITFSGDPKAPGQDPCSTEIDGFVFPIGKAVEVTNENLVAKLRGHSHFTIGDDRPTKADHLAKARAAKAAKKA